MLDNPFVRMAVMFFAASGFVMIVWMVIFVINELIDKLKFWIRYRIQRYKRKRMTTDPPVAKCRCIACEHWNRKGDEIGQCEMFGYNTDYLEFCSRSRIFTKDHYEWEQIHEKQRKEKSE